MERLKNTLQPIGKWSSRLADRLGRSPHAGDGLDSPIPLEGYGTTHDIQIAESAQPNDRRAAANKEAEGLVRSLSSLNEDTHPRRPKPAHRGSKESQSEKNVDDTWSSSGSGILSSLLKLQALQAGNSGRDSFYSIDSDSEVPSRPTTPPRKTKVRWYDKKPGASATSLPLLPDTSALKPHRRKKKRKGQIQLTVHVAEVIARQEYIMQLCRALMAYGAPTHRLQEYMQMTATVLEVDAQFLYLPSCMIMSFDDTSTYTTQVKLIRVIQGLDLGRLAEVHNIYKNVVHDVISVTQAVEELDQIKQRKPRYNKYLMIFLTGVTSACIGPWAFQARPIDMPIIFVLGTMVGFMQFILAPESVLYSNVFEVTVAILTSFLARAIGSIPARSNQPDEYGEFMFCFSAIAQSSITPILPGFAVLCSSLELQSHQMIAGSVRLVYTIIYSLFLGYGVTVGTTIYGLIDANASSQTSCPGATTAFGNEFIEHFPFVAVYCFLAAVGSQAKVKQTPIMIILGMCAYVTNYFCTKRLGSSMGLANTVGAFTIGVLANLYSRLWHGHAATAIVPGIFTIVSSGLASTGSIISGLAYADAVLHHDIQSLNSGAQWRNSISGLGIGMVQVAIGLTVGLFMSALVVYPFGKTRSALFSF